MATIYISYRHTDANIVSAIVPLLEAKNHKVLSDKELAIGVAWQDKLTSDLLSADVVLLLWTKDTRQSQFVPAEVGVVRATPKIGLLPVVIGKTPVPNFIKDLNVEQIPDTEPATLYALAQKLDASIKKHIEYRTRKKRGRPKVFISHRHKDESIVRALVECLELYFQIDTQDIRCTSVRPYRLPVGENTADRLRNEITDAEVVLGILNTDTLDSSYVAFELGSAWGQRVWTCPLLAGAADQSHIPDPIRGLSPLFLAKPGDCRQLLGDMEGFTSLEKRKKVDEGRLSDMLENLAKMARPPLSSAASKESGKTRKKKRK